MTSSPIPKRTFEIIAFGTLPLPFAATYALLPHLPRIADGSDVASLVRALVALLTLLASVVLWAIALLPLRRRTTLIPVMQDLASIGAHYEKARFDLHADATAAAPGPRRRYHLRMAVSGALVVIVTGGISAVMFSDPSERVLLWFPVVVVAVVSAALALYHLVRWARARSE